MGEKFHRVASPGAIRNLDHIWDYYLAPFRIAPHVYGVGGNNDVAVYLLDSGEGLILIDTGMAEFLYLVVDSIHRAGFDPRDIKLMLLSHAHGDHYNGARMLQAMSGAAIYMSAEDEAFYHNSPKIPGVTEVPFAVDRHYSDDVPITLGRFTIRTKLTPGHTPGTTSFFFDDTDDDTGETFHVGMHGGVGADLMRPETLARLHLPEALAHRFIADCEAMKACKVDICLPSHLNQVNLVANLPADWRDYRPLVDPTVWPDLMQERADTIKAFYPQRYPQ